MTPARFGHRAGGNYVYHYKAAGASKGELLTGTEDSLVIQERPRRSSSDGLGRPVHRLGSFRYQVTNETSSYIISTFAHRLYPSIMNSINRTRGVVRSSLHQSPAGRRISLPRACPLWLMSSALRQSSRAKVWATGTVNLPSAAYWANSPRTS